MTERIAKRIANAGLCSRREAERWIEEGRVQVNGEIISSPALNVSAEDAVLVDGTALPSVGQVRIFRMHKPAGFLCTNDDPKGRPTVFQLIPKHFPRMVMIGRLDLNSEGLLLFVTSGDVARKMMSPKTGLERTYRIRVFGAPNERALEKIREGVTIEGIEYRPWKISVDSTQTEGKNTWLTATITEGKNREIRKVMEYFDFTVNRLLRTDYGPFELGALKRMELNEIPRNKVDKFLKELEATDA